MKKNFLSLTLLSLASLATMVSCGSKSSSINDSSDNQSIIEETSSSIEESSSETSSSEETKNPVDYGKVKIDTLVVYVNYEGKAPTVKFTKPEMAEELTYTFNSTNIDYVDGKFVALNAGSSVKVTAKSEHFETTFLVLPLEFDYESQVAALEKTWINEGKKENQTVFIGDSFFDSYFFSNFASLFKNKDVSLRGISSTTLTDWMTFNFRLLYPSNPENVVIHLGTNDLWDDRNSIEGTLQNCKTLLDDIQKQLPSTKIYYFGIEPRNYTGNNTVFKTKAEIKEKLDVYNSSIKSYCEEKGYVYLDSPSYYYDDSGNMIESLTRDGIHPTIESYSIYKDLLVNAGIEMGSVEPVKTIANIERTLSDSVGSSKTVTYCGDILTENFILEGKINVRQMGTNAHIEFRFDDMSNRILLWDNDSDKTFNLGYAINGNYFSNQGSLAISLAEGGVDINFKIIANGKDLYFFINDTFQCVVYNSNNKGLVIGSENVECTISDMKALTYVDDKETFTSTIASLDFLKNSGSTSNNLVTNLSIKPSSRSISLSLLRDCGNTLDTSSTFNLVGCGTYTGQRDYVINKIFSSDFAIHYKGKFINAEGNAVDVANSQTINNGNTVNYFQYIGLSTTTSVNCWQYSNFVISGGDSNGYFGGNKWGLANSFNSTGAEDVLSNSNEYEMIMIRDGNTIYTGVKLSGIWYYSTNTAVSGDLTVWVGAENCAVQISDFTVTETRVGINQVESLANITSGSSKANISSIHYNVTDNVGAGAALTYQNSNLYRNFYVSMDVKFSEFGGNPHMSISINGYDNRYLIWDNDNDGTFISKLVRNANYGATPTSTTLSKAIDGTISFRLEMLVSDSKACIYINGVAQDVYDNLDGEAIIFGTENIGCDMTNITAVTAESDPEAFQEILAIKNL